MAGDIASAIPSGATAALILILVGLVVAYFGKTLFKVTAFLVGALAGGALGFFVAAWLGGGSVICMLAAVVVGAIVGGSLSLAIATGIIALGVGGVFAWAASLFLPGDVIVAMVAFLIGLVLALIFMNKLLAAITGVLGGAMAGLGVVMLLPGATGGIAGLIVGVMIALTGIYYQAHTHKGDLSKPDTQKGG
jgi:hypothetical protein